MQFCKNLVKTYRGILSTPGVIFQWSFSTPVEELQLNFVNTWWILPVTFCQHVAETYSETLQITGEAFQGNFDNTWILTYSEFCQHMVKPSSKNLPKPGEDFEWNFVNARWRHLPTPVEDLHWILSIAGEDI